MSKKLHKTHKLNKKPRIKTFIETCKEVRKQMPKPTKIIQINKKSKEENNWRDLYSGKDD